MSIFEEIVLPHHTIRVYSALRGPRSLDNDNLDIEVIRNADGVRFFATLFTLKNIAELMRKAAQTGEDGSGLYFWCSDLVIVPELSLKTIAGAIQELINNDELDQALQKESTIASDP